MLIVIRSLVVTSFLILFSTSAALPLQEGQTDQGTYDQATIVEEASDFLGTGAETAAKALESVFEKYGEPNAYITGSEAGGGFIVGLRYGGGTLNHKIEGARKIHWTGPSVGFDIGANAVKTFALVYNLHDSEEVYRRVAALEGSFYYVGGLGVSVYGRDDLILAIIRVGVGLRAQASLGYINFTKKRRYLPF